MTADASAYAALGLRPGAGPVEIEAAYRSLIKRHHPDRVGGDPSRAAEINGAYQQLRRQFGDELGRKRGPPVPVRTPRRQAPPRARLWALAMIVGVGALAISQREGISERFGAFELPVVNPWGTAGDAQARAAPLADLSQAPLDSVAIDQSVLDAVRIAGTGGEQALEAQSRACHRQLYGNPQPSRLDRCVAFDEAALALLDRDPFAGSGPFSASALAARHLRAGRLVSSDTLAVESRLARIRTMVELSMAPPQPHPASVRRPD